MSELVLALDVGTSSTRCSAYDARGTYVSDSRAVRGYRQAADGTLQLEVVARSCEEAIGETLDRIRRAARGSPVRGVGISVFALSWLGLDTDGRPLTPVYSYACRHGAAAAGRLRRQLQDEGLLEEFFAATGVPIHTAYAPALLTGLQEADPDLCGRVRWWQTLGAYLLSRWFGQVPGPVSTCEAGWTGLQDRHAGAWHAPWLSRLPLTAEQLPPLRNYSEGLQGLSTEMAARWPALRAAPFFLALGDGAAANIGSGALNAGSLAVTIGTSAATRVLVSQESEARGPRAPSGLWCYRVDRQRHLLGGAITDGGSIVRWMQEMLAAAPEEMEQGAAALAPDAHGLTVLPFLNGERSPGWADNATMTLQGISAATTPGHLLRAGMEAVAFRLALIARRLEAQLHPDAAVLASGGALVSSGVWRQVIADVLGREVLLLREKEVTSRGAAILAWQALNREEDLEPRLPALETVSPDPCAAVRYASALQRHQDLYAQLV